MFNLVQLTELGRQRRRDVARDVALCQQARSPRFAVGRTLVALGALAVVLGTAIGENSERQPGTTIA